MAEAETNTTSSLKRTWDLSLGSQRHGAAQWGGGAGSQQLPVGSKMSHFHTHIQTVMGSSGPASFHGTTWKSRSLPLITWHMTFPQWKGRLKHLVFIQGGQVTRWRCGCVMMEKKNQNIRDNQEFPEFILGMRAGNLHISEKGGRDKCKVWMAGEAPEWRQKGKGIAKVLADEIKSMASESFTRAFQEFLINPHVTSLLIITCLLSGVESLWLGSPTIQKVTVFPYQQGHHALEEGVRQTKAAWCTQLHPHTLFPLTKESLLTRQEFHQHAGWGLCLCLKNCGAATETRSLNTYLSSVDQETGTAGLVLG